MAIIKELKGDRPVIGERAFLAETSVLIGSVSIGEIGRADGCFLAIGYVPDTAFLGSVVNVDRFGYIIAGEDTKTGANGIFAAGDVRTKKLRQVVTAVSDGAAAALAASEYVEENK